MDTHQKLLAYGLGNGYSTEGFLEANTKHVYTEPMNSCVHSYKKGEINESKKNMTFPK